MDYRLNSVKSEVKRVQRPLLFDVFKTKIVPPSVGEMGAHKCL